jgi:hypothetical protein
MALRQRLRTRGSRNPTIKHSIDAEASDPRSRNPTIKHSIDAEASDRRAV